jgi:hypothetical protein
MISARRLARILVRLSLPAALLVFALAPAPAKAYPYPRVCTDGNYNRYYDANGDLCAMNDDCDHYYWGTCDDDLSYAYADEQILFCGCH